MSPLLFNFFMLFMPYAFFCRCRHVHGQIDKSIGVTAGFESQEKCNKTALAYDLLLLSSTDIGMKTLLKQLEAEMAKVGLVMNPEKCAFMRTEIVSGSSGFEFHALLETARRRRNSRPSA